MADHRPDIYREGDKWIIRASSMSFCTQRLVAQGLGMEGMDAPDVVQRGYDEGADNEARLLNAWRGGSESGVEVIGPYADRYKGLTLPKWKGLDPRDASSYMQSSDGGVLYPHSRLDMLDDGQFTVEWAVGNAILRGHMDGIGQCYEAPAGVDSLVGDRVMEEGKLLGLDYWKKWLKRGWGAFPHYAMQVSTYGYATGLPVVFIVGRKVRRDDGGVDIPEIHVTWIEPGELPVGRGVVMARVVRLARLCEAGDLSAVGGCDRDDWPCPVSYLHDGVKVMVEEAEALPVVEVATDQVTEFVTALEMWERAAKSASTADKDKKAMAKVLADVIAECGVDPDTRTVVRGGGREVEWYVEERKETVVKGYTMRYAKVRKMAGRNTTLTNE